jgi:hypothetical protein
MACTSHRAIAPASMPTTRPTPVLPEAIDTPQIVFRGLSQKAESWMVRKG